MRGLRLMLCLGVLACQSVPEEEPSYVASVSDSAAIRTEVTCPGLAEINNTENDATAVLQACVDQAPDRAVLALNAGAYTLRRRLVLQRPITIGTAGVGGQTPCGSDTTHPCAELRAAADFAESDGFILMTGSAVSLDHIVINGRKDLRERAKQLCKGNSNRFGFNIVWTQCADCSFLHSVSKEAACGTGLEMSLSPRPTVQGAVFAANGVHDRSMLWADGLTITDAEGASVVDNSFVDNTDIDLIFGGCQRCIIERNTIRHSGTYREGAFAALMLHAWPTTSGDYTGTTAAHNFVDCGVDKGCGFGIYVGSRAWYKSNPVRGLTLRDNVTYNTQSGFVIGKDVDAVDIGDNDAGPSNGRVRCQTSRGERRMHAFIVEPKSPANFVGQRVGREYYVEADFEGAIPNFKPGCR